MDQTRLADFDELVVRCRDAQARAHIAEAAASYRAGAFRACIVTTWIAVVYDIMAKLRELDAAGDAAAKAEVLKLANMVTSHDVDASLTFEKGVLLLARDTFALLTPNEHDDLERLRQDRNRCAHPSMNSLEQPYSPPAELARYHLRSAVQHLLMHEPVQGKAALDRLYADVRSAYFPTDAGKARVFFSQGPLRRPKDNLVTTFTTALVTSMLGKEPLTFDELRRRAAALTATRNMHRQLVEPALATKAAAVMRGLGDAEFHHAARFIALVPDTWPLLPVDVQGKLTAYAGKLDPATDPLTTQLLLDTPELAATVRTLVAKARSDGLAALIASQPRPEYVEPALNYYLSSTSFNDNFPFALFDSAKTLATKLIVALVPHFNKEQLERLMQVGSQNAEIRASLSFPTVLNVLRSSNIVPTAEFDAMKQKYGL